MKTAVLEACSPQSTVTRSCYRLECARHGHLAEQSGAPVPVSSALRTQGKPISQAVSPAGPEFFPTSVGCLPKTESS